MNMLSYIYIWKTESSSIRQAENSHAFKSEDLCSKLLTYATEFHQERF